MIKKGFLRLLFILIFLFSAAKIYATQQTAEATQQTIGINPIMFFLILIIACIAIGILAMLAGVGGGVVFTPIMMGFTPIDSFIVRATGLFIAMAGALVAAKPYLSRGIANIKILFWSAVPYTVSCVIGALLAGYVKAFMGLKGEAFVRGALGLIVIGIALLFIFAGKRIEYPEVESVDRFTERIGLGMAYWEDSLGKVVDYKVRHADIALILFSGVGLISGFFGLGAGWAMVPVFNLVMLAPLKVAATCSVVMIGIGDSAAIWPYIMGGGILPLFAVPCMIGLITGAIIGAKIMLKVKAGFVRWIIIFIMFLAGIRLILKAIEIWGMA